MANKPASEEKHLIVVEKEAIVEVKDLIADAKDPIAVRKHLNVEKKVLTSHTKHSDKRCQTTCK